MSYPAWAEGLGKYDKEKIRKESYWRIRNLLRTELSCEDKVITINTMAIPITIYSFNIIIWTLAKKTNNGYKS